MKKLIYAFIATITMILLFIILLGGSYGETLSVKTIDVLEDTRLEEPLATCSEYYNEAISTFSMYEDFVDTCKVDKELQYDEDYFLERVLVVYNYQGKGSKTPRTFHDYIFSVNGKETIKVGYNLSFFSKDDMVWNFYLIEMRRDQIATKTLVIG